MSGTTEIQPATCWSCELSPGCPARARCRLTTGAVNGPQRSRPRPRRRSGDQDGLQPLVGPNGRGTARWRTAGNRWSAGLPLRVGPRRLTRRIEAVIVSCAARGRPTTEHVSR